VISLVLFLLGWFVVRHEMCTCPSHWAFLSVFGVVPLVCGPRASLRLSGIVAIALAVLFTYHARQTQKEISKRWGPFIEAGKKP
jgi:hypothetical protein